MIEVISSLITTMDDTQGTTWRGNHSDTSSWLHCHSRAKAGGKTHRRIARKFWHLQWGEQTKLSFGKTTKILTEHQCLSPFQFGLIHSDRQSSFRAPVDLLVPFAFDAQKNKAGKRRTVRVCSLERDRWSLQEEGGKPNKKHLYSTGILLVRQLPIIYSTFYTEGYTRLRESHERRVTSLTSVRWFNVYHHFIPIIDFVDVDVADARSCLLAEKNN
jgi:hypothetical protein